MEPLETEEKPFLVQCTGKGFSDFYTVRYKSKYLYSKYNPVNATEQLIQNTVILDGSIIMLCSPLLWYGMDSLLKKAPQQSLIIAFEADDNLLAIAREKQKEKGIEGVALFGRRDLEAADSLVRNAIKSGLYRRCIRMNMSAGVDVREKDYDTIQDAVQELITSFWHNRITLTKMGRLYSKNLFENLMHFSSGRQLDDIKASVDQDIIVVGAGESTEKLEKKDTEGKYVIAVDMAVKCLVQKGIHIDAAVVLESQLAIQSVFIGEWEHIPLLFADLTSRPSVARYAGEKTVWFCTRFSPAAFLDDLQESGIARTFLEPRGSVGLSALDIALALRKSDGNSIYVCGMDFSYSIARTHAKGSGAYNTRAASQNRMRGIENFDAAFAQTAIKATGKDSSTVITTAALSSYASSFAAVFAPIPNVYDMTSTGLPLALAHRKPVLAPTQKCADDPTHPEISISEEKRIERQGKAAAYIKRERAALEKAKELLINAEKSAVHDSSRKVEDELEELLSRREYLFLHFPDGCTYRGDLPFLKRVRAEIDFFLKRMDNSNL